MEDQKLDAVRDQLQGHGEFDVFAPRVVFVRLTPEEAQDLNVASARAFGALRELMEELKKRDPATPEAIDYYPDIITQNFASHLFKVTEAQASSFLVKLLHKSLAYNSEIRTEDNARNLAREVMDLVRSEAFVPVAQEVGLLEWIWTFFTGQPERVRWFINHQLSFMGGVSPVSSATIDGCVLGISSVCAVLFWVHDED